MSKATILIKLKENKWWHLLLLILLPVAIYIQSIKFDYTNFDDNGIILQKIDVIKNIKNLDTAFKVDAFFNKTGDFYRPVQNISFMLDAQVSGEKLWMFHISNLLIHVLTVVSLYFFLQFLSIKRFTSFLLALFFAVHPLFASGVGWIASRGDILIGLLGLQLFLSFGLYYKTKNILYFLYHVVLFAVTIFTKETTVLFPLFFLYYYYLILPESISENFVNRTLKLIPFCFFWLGIFIVYFLLRQNVVANTGANADVLGVIPFFKNNTVIPTIIGQFFVPFSLSTLPLYSNAATIVGIAFLLLIVFITLNYTIHKKWIVLMGFLWFLLFAIPPTIYRLDNADTFFNYLEHRTYLPMLGIVIILAFYLNDKLEKEKFRKIFVLIYVPLIIVFSVLAFIHCADYKNNFTLSSRAAVMNNPSGLAMRANNYMEKKDTTNALLDINRAIELSPKDAGMFLIRGKIKAKMMQHENADADFSMALSLNPNLVDALMSRSIERRYLKKYEAAFRDIYSASKIDSLNPKIYFSFGNLFVATENYTEAVNSFTKAIQINKNYAEAYNNRAYAKLFVRDFAGAITDADSAKNWMPKNAIVYNNLGQAYRALKDFTKAEENFNKAIELDANFGQAFYERGLLYQIENEKPKACSDFAKAIQLDYTNAQAVINTYCK